MRPLTAALALLVAGPALGANGMRTIGFGPVQASMGGVGVGASLDAGTVLSSPAGMADLDARADLGLALAGASVSQEADYSGIAIGYVADASRRGPTLAPAFGLVVPLGEDWRLGFGAYGVASLGADYLYGIAGAPSHASYGLVRYAPAVSWRALPGLSLGAALNLMHATLDSGLSAVDQYALGGTAFGVGATLSARFSPLPWLDLAAAFETKGLFSDFEFDTVQTGTAVRRTSKLNQPMVATLGAGVRPLPTLLLAADLQWIGWSGVLGPQSSLRLGWRDQVIGKLGAQLELAGLLLRAGLDYGPTPVDPNLAFDMMLPAIAETHLALGLGAPLGRGMTLNLSGVWLPRTAVKGTDTTSFGGAAVPFQVWASGYQLQAAVAIAY